MYRLLPAARSQYGGCLEVPAGKASTSLKKNKHQITLNPPFRPLVGRFTVGNQGKGEEGKAVERYKVKKGDTLSKIALLKMHDANLWPEIAEENNLRSPFTIYEEMLLDVPTSATDRRNQCSVHAPMHFLQDHVSVHAPIHDLEDNVCVHASFRSNSFRSLPCGQNKLEEAGSIECPNLKIPFEATAIQVQSDRTITIKVKGELKLKNKGNIANLGLTVRPDLTGSFESEGKFYDADGEIGSSGVALKVKTAYHKKLVDLIGSPQIEFEREAETGSITCGLPVSAKIGDKKITAKAVYNPARPNEYRFLFELEQLPANSGEWEVSGKVSYDVTISYKVELERYKLVQFRVTVPIAMPSMKLDPLNQAHVVGTAAIITILATVGMAILAL
jgi:hypothetical protein